jgi:hypothetical protein
VKNRSNACNHHVVIVAFIHHPDQTFGPFGSPSRATNKKAA